MNDELNDMFRDLSEATYDLIKGIAIYFLACLIAYPIGYLFGIVAAQILGTRICEVLNLFHIDINVAHIPHIFAVLGMVSTFITGVTIEEDKKNEAC